MCVSLDSYKYLMTWLNNWTVDIKRCFGMKMKVLLLFVVFSGFIATNSASSGYHNNLTEKFSWRQLEFAWTSDNERQEAVNTRRYIPNNNLPLAFDIWRDRIFLTVPRCIILLWWCDFLFNTIIYEWKNFHFGCYKFFILFIYFRRRKKRWKDGVASSLNYIDVTDEKSAPVLNPYPSWKVNQLETSGSEQPKIASSFGIRGNLSQFVHFSC